MNILLFTIAALGVLPVFASASNDTISVSGRLLNSTQNPVTASSVSFRVVVYDPSGNCPLYGEDSLLDMSASNGNFEIKLGTGAAVSGISPMTLRQALDNRVSFTGLTGCGSGTVYTPAPDDTRKLKISFDEGSGSHSLSMVDMGVVPWASHARTVGGFAAENLIRVEESGSPVSVPSFSQAHYNSLMSLITGTSTLFSKPAANGTTPLANLAAPSSPAAGQMWFDSGSIKYFDGGSVQTLGVAGASGVFAVTASSPLTVTGTVATPNITISSASTSSPGVVILAGNGTTAAGTVVQANDGRLSDVRIPSGAAGGDLSGTYPNPNVSKIGGVGLSMTSLTTGQTLRYNGTNWVNSSLTTADLANGADLLRASNMPANCSSFQTLTFSSPTGTWACSAISIDASVITAGTIDAARLPAGLNVWSKVGSDISYNAGNVGIGTTSPDFPLTVAGVIKSTSSGYGLWHEGGTAQLATFVGNNYGQFGTQNSYKLALQTGGTDRMTISTTGDVGIGINAPRSKLDVNGVILGKAATNVASGVSTINFASGNLQFTTGDCKSYSLTNIKDGGSYMFVIKGTGSYLCSFSASGFTVHMPPDHGPTIASKQTLYNFVVLDADVYVSWTPGY